MSAEENKKGEKMLENTSHKHEKCVKNCTCLSKSTRSSNYTRFLNSDTESISSIIKSRPTSLLSKHSEISNECEINTHEDNDLSDLDMDFDRISLLKSKSLDTLSTACSRCDGDMQSLGRGPSIKSIYKSSDSMFESGKQELKAENNPDQLKAKPEYIGDKNPVYINIQPEYLDKDICLKKRNVFQLNERRNNKCSSFNLFSLFSTKRKLGKISTSYCLDILLCGLGLVSAFIGSTLPFGFLSFYQLTESYKHVEGEIPYYVSATIMTICGFLTIFTSFRRHRVLIGLILILSFICTAFCTISLIYLIAEVNKLEQLQDCYFDSYGKICQCYVTTSNGSKKLFRFAKVVNCHSVKENLREIVYGVCVLFAFGCLTSIFAALASGYLLCKDRKQTGSDDITLSRVISTTTQTQESSFTSPRDSFNCYTANMHEIKDVSQDPTTTPNDLQGVDNYSVSTQTPLYLLPYDSFILTGNEEDDNLDLLIDDCNEPPSYNDAIASLAL